MTAIRKLLIANRGEIACRVMRSAKTRGVKTVAVYSDADATAMHVRCADEAIHIGGAAPSESYLKIDAVIEAARKSGADAIHPGYGFLSERAEFAKACTDAGIIFMGPPAAAIAEMGDKSLSKRRMIDAGVPCVPGYQGDDQSDDTLIAEAKKIGFPVMVKASAGGGGRGMRVVQDEKDLSAAIASARKEAESAFGDGRLLLERAVVGARHVEIQVFGDGHGNVIHLGERDCSLQRRNQKVIEEAPSPVVNKDMRAKMGAAAVKAAQAVDYVGAGTVEFLYDPARDEFYFLEMNTRLQVEHPVTEMVTGLDLVALQFDVAEGKKLALTQDDVSLTGWAMEARLYAEDPANGFMPQTGDIAFLEFSDGAGLRVDAGVETGDAVTAHYDPMIAKVIAYGATRDEARARLASGLRETALVGVGTNAAFLIRLLEDDTFAKGAADTQYIESNLDAICGEAWAPGALDIAIAAAVSICVPQGGLLTGWNSRGSQFFPLKLRSGDDMIEGAARIDGRTITGRVAEKDCTIEVISQDGPHLVYRADGRRRTAIALRRGAVIDIKHNDVHFTFEDVTHAPSSSAGGAADNVVAPMAGLVTGVAVKTGDRVAKGDVVATIEAMKMEHQLKAPRDGIVADALVKEGDQLAIRAKIIVLETEE